MAALVLGYAVRLKSNLYLMDGSTAAGAFDGVVPSLNREKKYKFHENFPRGSFGAVFGERQHLVHSLLRSTGTEGLLVYMTLNKGLVPRTFTAVPRRPVGRS